MKLELLTTKDTLDYYVSNRIACGWVWLWLFGRPITSHSSRLALSSMKLELPYHQKIVIDYYEAPFHVQQNCVWAGGVWLWLFGRPTNHAFFFFVFLFLVDTTRRVT